MATDLKYKNQNSEKAQRSNTMNQMFDTRPQKSQDQREELVEETSRHMAQFHQDLIQDYISKSFVFCHSLCLKPNQDYDQSEQTCALNCVRKLNRTYRQFKNQEDSLYKEFNEDLGIGEKELKEIAETRAKELQKKKMESTLEDLGKLTRT